MVLTLALSYGGREEIVEAARRASKGAAPLDEESIAASLWTAGLPELDLLVRTSGERRISNFLLWQAAYAELHFSEILWPEQFSEERLRAIRQAFRYQAENRCYSFVEVLSTCPTNWSGASRSRLRNPIGS
jgi:undecaprenyl diphosphate synthase